MPLKCWTPLVSVITYAVMMAAVAGCAALEPWPRRGVVAQGRAAHPAKESTRALDPGQVAAELLVLHNRLRADAKLSSLAVSKMLQAAAEEHVREMAERHKMTHKGKDGSTPSARITAQGYRIRRCGENIAFGPKTPEAVMKGWMNSPSHRANILGNFSQIGAAYAIAPDGTAFWCVTFGLPARRK